MNVQQWRVTLRGDFEFDDAGTPDVLSVPDVKFVASLDIEEFERVSPVLVLADALLPLQVLVFLGRGLLALHEHLHYAINHSRRLHLELPYVLPAHRTNLPLLK